MRRRQTVLLVVLATAPLLACVKEVPAADVASADAGVAAASDPAPVAAPQPTGPGLVLVVEPADAELIIDGASQGSVAELSSSQGFLTLKPGIYQVALKRPGYVSWRAEVTVNEKPERLQVSLVKQP